MSLQDPIADMLTRVRNAQLAKHEGVSMPYSTLKENIACVLKKEGFILDYSSLGDVKKTLNIILRYEDVSRRKPLIRKLGRVSRPGLRVYKGYQDIPHVKQRMGVVILSTPLGVISGKEARKKKVGGEILAIVE